MQGNVVGVGLVGYGYWGPNLARNFHQLPGSRLVACCDQSPERLQRAQQAFPHLRVTPHLDEMLHEPEVDAVVVATPVHTHYQVVRAALLAGKHVLVEKPLTADSGEAAQLTALAQERGVVLMVGHTFEYNPAVWKMKELLDAGELGQVYYAYSTRVNLGRLQRDLNALWSIAPHDISILIYLFGAMPEEVSARGGTYLEGGIEDVVFVDLQFPGGVVAHVHASWLDPCKVRRMTLVGSKKMVLYDDVASEDKIRVYDKGVLRVGNGQIFGEFHYKVHSGDIWIPRIDASEPLQNESAHFVECIVKGLRPRSDGASGLRVVQVLEAAQRSLAQRGAPVAVG
ncbi:MAG: Gfo/Idh/MocA family oxidoreductase [Chloroflexi bacterium]|nr:Gfo/Idh/MocA family oxidoreductase [Chloroflexota bacterium]